MLTLFPSHSPTDLHSFSFSFQRRNGKANVGSQLRNFTGSTVRTLNLQPGVCFPHTCSHSVLARLNANATVTRRNYSFALNAGKCSMNNFVFDSVEFFSLTASNRKLDSTPVEISKCRNVLSYSHCLAL